MGVCVCVCACVCWIVRVCEREKGQMARNIDYNLGMSIVNCGCSFLFVYSYLIFLASTVLQLMILYHFTTEPNFI